MGLRYENVSCKSLSGDSAKVSNKHVFKKEKNYLTKRTMVLRNILQNSFKNTCKTYIDIYLTLICLLVLIYQIKSIKIDPLLEMHLNK
jgi:hypothetical protein